MKNFSSNWLLLCAKLNAAFLISVLLLQKSPNEGISSFSGSVGKLSEKPHSRQGLDVTARLGPKIVCFSSHLVVSPAVAPLQYLDRLEVTL